MHPAPPNTHLPVAAEGLEAVPAARLAARVPQPRHVQRVATKPSQARGAAQQPLQHVAIKAIVVPHLARAGVGEERHKGLQDARCERVSTQLGHAGGRHAAAQETADREAALRQVGGGRAAGAAAAAAADAAAGCRNCV